MNFLNQIINFWPIIIFIGAVIGSWVHFTLKVSNLEKKSEVLEERIKTLETDTDKFREKIMVSIERIETTLKFIREKIEKI
jgi:predicted  nucleic acid-binding Zn-ribbon protein